MKRPTPSIKSLYCSLLFKKLKLFALLGTIMTFQKVNSGQSYYHNVDLSVAKILIMKIICPIFKALLSKCRENLGFSRFFVRIMKIIWTEILTPEKGRNFHVIMNIMTYFRLLNVIFPTELHA